ncbi:MAG: RICIN domain-containing protein, partial [Catenulispora sp.]|nr:RICIN domain-containing protein [Catenulispora sp.]
YSATPHSAGQTHFLVGKAPSDSSGAAVSSASTYGLGLGSTALADGTGTSAAAWKLVPVADAFNATYSSGFYRLQNVGTGKFLQVPRATPAARRALGAAVATGAQQADFSSAGDGGQGSPSGSDQWYLQPVGKDTPRTLSPSSGAADVVAATNTSLAGVTSYKLVNRNSGLVLENVGGTWQLAGQDFYDAAQPVTISKLS